MTPFEQIDDYFNGQMPPEERSRFEDAIRTDGELAEAVAFYLSARQAAKTEYRRQRRQEWEARRPVVPEAEPRRVRFWSYAAAASLALLLGVSWYLQEANPSAQEIADQYATEITTLGRTMGSEQDSLQRGIRLYNEGRFAEALALFDQQLARDPANEKALELSGIVSLRTGNYDQAINQFDRLSRRTELASNPGLYYKAVALLKRNLPNDKKEARQLLETVIKRNLDGSREASRLLEEF